MADILLLDKHQYILNKNNHICSVQGSRGAILQLTPLWSFYHSLANLNLIQIFIFYINFVAFCLMFWVMQIYFPNFVCLPTLWRYILQKSLKIKSDLSFRNFKTCPKSPCTFFILSYYVSELLSNFCANMLLFFANYLKFLHFNCENHQN